MESEHDHNIADTADMKDDAVVLFESVSQYFERLDRKGCDKVLRNGTAQAFAKSLHDQCLLHKKSLDASASDAEDFKAVRNSRILHISVLCKALALILRCSDSEIQSPHYCVMKQHLVASIPCVAQMMLTLQGYGSMPLTTVSNAIRIMHRIAPFIDLLPSEFMKASARSLHEELPTDLRTDAALSLVCFLTHKSRELYKLEREDDNRLVSILCVAATTSIEPKMEEALEALTTLVTSCTYFAKIATRKCCILAAKQNLVHENKAIRRRAFDILDSVVNSHGLDNGPPGICASNMDCIVQGLIEGATTETEIDLTRDILNLLVRLVTSDSLPIGTHKHAEILTVLARRGTGKDDVCGHSSEHAAICYLKAAAKSLQNEDILSRVVDFITCSHAPVRSHALAMVQDLLFWRPSMAETVFRQTSLLANMSMIICNGPAKDRAAAMQICKTLVSDPLNHCQFLKCDDFVSSLIRFITSTATKDLPTLVTALDILLTLMLTTECGVDYFLKSSELLPWVVALANRTSCSDLKVRLVAAIQRMTLRLMDESH